MVETLVLLYQKKQFVIKYPLVIPQFNLESNTYTEREFLTQRDFLSFVEGKWKLPGQYNLKRTDLWRQPAIKFQKDKTYCDFHEQSEDYKNWWKFEKRKTKHGVIYNIGEDEFYVTGDYYWYLNFIQIDDQLLGREEFPEVWDSDYHFFLYVVRCELRNKNSCVVKKRRSGYSLKHVAMLIKDLWFVRSSVSKMIAYEEDAVSGKNGSWKFVEAYRNFLNTNTPWYRSFDPDEKLNWKQQQAVVEGDIYTKKVYKGLMSTITAATCKKDVAKAVGGKSTKIFWEESGKNPVLDAGLGYAGDTAKLGSVKTGMQFVSGAVGELKDCKPLEKYALDPETNGFLGVEDVFSENPQGKICFFVPDYWNYLGYNEEEGQIIKCYDEDGNSDIELAKTYILKEEEEAKKQGEADYRLWKSQHPWNLQDAFAMREENPFPVDIIKEHQTLLIQTYKPLTVELKKEQGKLKHHFIEGFPVRTLKVDPNKDNRGCIEIYELPVPNPPWGLYYAGVDPISAKNTSTSKSLQSVTIYKAIHYVGDKITMDYPVAQYTGRHPKWEDTYRISLDLIKFYNARTCVENNITSFIEWCIKEGESKWLMRRKEVTMVNEFVPQSTVRDEIGVRMEGELKKKALDFIQTYVDEIIGTEFDEEGNAHYIYGVTRIKDPMVLEEMLKFNPRLNTDRLISFMLALMAARSNTNRNIIVETREFNAKPQVNKKVTMSSPFLYKPQQKKLILPNQFTKRK